MANYNAFSRRGLIKMNNDYDKVSNGALHNFLEDKEDNYEEVRPFEQIAERLDEVTETIQERGGMISNAMMDRVNHVFDSMIAGMTEEINRCESVMDEQSDDDSYPDDGDEDDE